MPSQDFPTTAPSRDRDVQAAASPPAWAGKRRIAAIFAFVMVLIAVDANTRFTSEMRADGLENAHTALTLARHGVFGYSKEEGPHMYREPIPIAVMAAQIAIDPRLRDMDDITEMQATPRLFRAFKQNALLWVVLLCLGSLLLLRELGYRERRLLVFGLLLLVILWRYFIIHEIVLDRNYNELKIATLLVFIGFCAHRAFFSLRLRRFAILGTVLGIGCLTSATLIYLVPPFIVAMGFAALMRFGVRTWKARLCEALLIAVACGAVMAPWLIRNKVHFDTYSASARGGIVLFTRAMKNTMSPTERRGGYWYYAHRNLRPILSPLLGFDAEDVEPGGRLERLNRRISCEHEPGSREDLETICSIHHRVRDELFRRASEQPIDDPAMAMLETEREMREEAMLLIRRDPWMHLSMTPLLTWRGLWTLQSGWLSLLLAPLSLVALIVVATHALLRRRTEVLAVFLLPVGWILFYALLTHFLPRYMIPIVPLMLVATVHLIGTSVPMGLSSAASDAPT